METLFSMLGSEDELRHPANDDPNWRESLYFNFNDNKNRIGGWIYSWVLPNQPLATGMLVAFYRGDWREPGNIDKASATQGHCLRRGNEWIYAYQHNAPDLINDDFDNFSFAGLQLERTSPLKSYKLTFDDGADSGFDLDAAFLTLPYDYADGVNPTPTWMAANRYHRAHHIKGELRIAGETFAVDCTGDSDHSWGQRDMAAFGSNLFKMWSMQTPDGSLSVSVIAQGIGNDVIALGFVSIRGVMASAKTISSQAVFDDSGLQSKIDLEVTDQLDRTIRARMDTMHSCVGWRTDHGFWGFEGVGDFKVEDWGTVPGLTSYFWPSTITPGDLVAGKWN